MAGVTLWVFTFEYAMSELPYHSSSYVEIVIQDKDYQA